MDEQQPATSSECTGANDAHVSCQQQFVELESKYKRAVADYANREKELAREREDFARWATVDLIRDVLPVMDAIVAAGGETSGVDRKTPDVEPAPIAASGEPAAQQGFRAIQVLLHNFLQRHGVEPIGTIGDRVDYLLHEIVGTRKGEGSPSEVSAKEGKDAGIILEIIQVGYQLHGRLLRPAKVIVSE